jgi:hypothetical protein
MCVLVYVIGIFRYSCDSGAVSPAGCCFAAGRSCFESAVPVLCSGLLWAGSCADSAYCEVSFFVFFYFFHLLFLLFRFLYILLAVVVYLVMVWF